PPMPAVGLRRSRVAAARLTPRSRPTSRLRCLPLMDRRTPPEHRQAILPARARRKRKSSSKAAASSQEPAVRYWLLAIRFLAESSRLQREIRQFRAGFGPCSRKLYESTAKSAELIATRWL